MPRVVGIDIPKEKRIEIALTYVYGVGNTVAKRILKATNIQTDVKAKDLTEDEVLRISTYIQKEIKHEGTLRREMILDIKRLMDIGCYRGIRHKKSLPVRGQRTKTNARTRKGPKKTMAGKKKETK
ncbi:MAG: small subunit ribosomal protein S13 [Candidatus Omnitrophota bacterium]|jgi:small subunit ribosomal protein S13